MTAGRTALSGPALPGFAMFVDTLVVSRPRVLGIEGGDMTRQFLPWRDFGFSELAKGNLALWNPHMFAGAPYFGGTQSAPELFHIGALVPLLAWPSWFLAVWRLCGPSERVRG